MTIFHVIKYKLSPLPTPEELIALPDSIFEAWSQEVMISSKPSKKTATMISMCLRAAAFNRVTGPARVKKHMDSLRRYLMEYEE